MLKQIFGKKKKIKAMTAIKTLQIALEKMAITHEHLTPIHSYFVQVNFLKLVFFQKKIQIKSN